MNATRFCPTYNDDNDLHVGHALCAIINMVYAWKTERQFIVRVSIADHVKQLSFEWLDRLQWYFPYSQLCIQHPKYTQLPLNHIALTSYNINITYGKTSPILLGAIYDLLFDVDVIVRGKEWSGQIDELENVLEAKAADALVKLLSHSDIYVNYIPLMIYNKQKISKSQGIKEYALIYLWDHYSIHPIEIFFYILSLVFNRIIMWHEWPKLMDEFDIEKICNIDYIEFNLDYLLQLHNQYEVEISPRILNDTYKNYINMQGDILETQQLIEHHTQQQNDFIHYHMMLETYSIIDSHIAQEQDKEIKTLCQQYKQQMQKVVSALAPVANNAKKTLTTLIQKLERLQINIVQIEVKEKAVRKQQLDKLYKELFIC